MLDLLKIFLQLYLVSKAETLQSKGSHQGNTSGGENIQSARGHEPGLTFENYMTRLSKISNGKTPLPNYEPTRFSDKSYGVIRAFAVCTNQGLVRNYNEDRVAIVLNILRPNNKPQNEYWPNCSFFGVYDGHGGNKCAEFLRNNLHQYVINRY